MRYKLGDIIDTTLGIMTVQCSLPFKANNDPKYNKLGGKTLHWLLDHNGNDHWLWDEELNNILSDDEIRSRHEKVDLLEQFS